jgi:hypothetical protein
MDDIVKRLRDHNFACRTDAHVTLVGNDAADRIEELELLASCACGDGFTKDAPGKCWICFSTQQTLDNIALSKRVAELESKLATQAANI